MTSKTYLRDMGAVELSREGEIAIAKRIEAEEKMIKTFVKAL